MLLSDSRYSKCLPLVGKVACYYTTTQSHEQLEMWANAQRDGRPAEYRWRPLFNTAKFWLMPTTSVVQ